MAEILAPQHLKHSHRSTVTAKVRKTDTLASRTMSCSQRQVTDRQTCISCEPRQHAQAGAGDQSRVNEMRAQVAQVFADSAYRNGLELTEGAAEQRVDTAAAAATLGTGNTSRVTHRFGNFADIEDGGPVSIRRSTIKRYRSR